MPKSKKKKRRLVKSISAQDIPYFKYRVEWIDCVSDSGWADKTEFESKSRRSPSRKTL
jgi:hypothetical protein